MWFGQLLRRSLDWIDISTTNSSISSLQGIAASICTSFNWLVSFAVTYVVPPLGDAINPSSCYFIFAAIAAAGTLFIAVFVPETKGKTEDEIRSLFS